MSAPSLCCSRLPHTFTFFAFLRSFCHEISSLPFRCPLIWSVLINPNATPVKRAVKPIVKDYCMASHESRVVYRVERRSPPGSAATRRKSAYTLSKVALSSDVQMWCNFHCVDQKSLDMWCSRTGSVSVMRESGAGVIEGLYEVQGPLRS